MLKIAARILSEVVHVFFERDLFVLVLVCAAESPLDRKIAKFIQFKRIFESFVFDKREFSISVVICSLESSLQKMVKISLKNTPT